MLRTPSTLRLAVATLTAVAVAGLAGCSTDNNNTSGMPGMDHGTSSASAAPSTSASPATGPHNQADVMFAQAMIPHHQQAIEMSDIILAKDDINPQVSDLATQIKAAQGPEIATMRGWLAGWGENSSPSMGMDHDTGGGMMSRADMDALQKATGDEAARLFLTGMIAHHQGAITMAEHEIANGQNPDAQQLAQVIIDAQQAEITTLKTLLEQL
jgi:uncharacterized protein (DUF305 family)